MAVLAQICVIFAICLAGEGITAVLPFPFPASVMSMVLLLALLAFRLLKPRQLHETSGFLLNNMAMFFIPANVGIIKYKELIFGNLWPILLISLLTTPLVFFVTGHVVQLTMRVMRRKGEKQTCSKL